MTTLVCRHREIHFPRRPLVMGIVNVNDDSFCGDGTLDPDGTWTQAQRQAEAGADIIDLGAESARTNRAPITVDEEIRRLQPLVADFPRRAATWRRWDAPQVWPPLLSVNTWRPEVAEALLPLGGDILNDIGALPDDRNARTCAQHGVALVIMHSVGLPKVPHTHIGYENVVEAVLTHFREKIALAQAAGLSLDRLILDPGLDFAKQRDDNLRLLQAADRLQALRRPVLWPLSRKGFIGEVLELPDPRDRDAGTIGCLALLPSPVAQIYRVHHVAATAASNQVLWSLE
jgi:dihydropteroate synthase